LKGKKGDLEDNVVKKGKRERKKKGEGGCSKKGYRGRELFGVKATGVVGHVTGRKLKEKKEGITPPRVRGREGEGKKEGKYYRSTASFRIKKSVEGPKRRKVRHGSRGRRGGEKEKDTPTLLKSKNRRSALSN